MSHVNLPEIVVLSDVQKGWLVNEDAERTARHCVLEFVLIQDCFLFPSLWSLSL